MPPRSRTLPCGSPRLHTFGEGGAPLCHKCRATAALVDVGKFSAGVTASDHSIVKVMACQELQWQPGGQGTGRTPARGRIPRFRDRPPKYGQYTTPGGENYRELRIAHLRHCPDAHLGQYQSERDRATKSARQHMQAFSVAICLHGRTRNPQAGDAAMPDAAAALLSPAAN